MAVQHKKFEKNTKGRDFVVGDIHGCLLTLEACLKEINFNKETDRMFSVGDLVDRGAQSLDCAYLTQQDWFHSVIGNHEQMAIDYLEYYPRSDGFTYYANGGGWFIDLTPSLQQDIVKIFTKLPYTITVETENGRVGICHSNPIFDDWDETTNAFIDDNLAMVMLWDRSIIKGGLETQMKNVDRVYVGHTPLKESLILGNIYHIDTGCVYGKSLTIYNIDGTVAIKKERV